MILGAHCSTRGGIWKALERAASIGASACQVFVKNNMQWLSRPFSAEEVRKFETQRQACEVAWVFGHAGYLINLAGPPSDNRNHSLRSLAHELDLAEALGLPFLVLHPGAHLGTGERAGIRRVAAALNQVFRSSRAVKVRIALENTAGQGTCLGSQPEHLAAIYDGVKCPQRLGLCLDTAHAFAAGFDLRTPAGWDETIARIERLLGLREVVAFHLNDSRSDLGSRVDRHAGIGGGKIGREAFRHIVNDARFKDLPGCLETPKSEDLHEDVENLAILRSLQQQRAGCTAAHPSGAPELRRGRATGRRRIT